MWRWIGALCIVSPSLAAEYVPLGGLVANEGATVGEPILNCGIECCKRHCDQNDLCNSFSLHGRAKICYLKDACVNNDASQNIQLSKYTTWKATSCVDPVTNERRLRAVENAKKAAALDAERKAKAEQRARLRKPTQQHTENVEVSSGGDVRSTGSSRTLPQSSNLLEQLRRIHQHCISEMYTNKWDGKAGSNLGSPTVKKAIQNPESTFCTNADWESAMKRLNFSPDNDSRYRALFPPSSDPCSADQLYHYVGSGIGSWVSNIANLLYVADSQHKTLGFRDQRPLPDGTTKPNQRYELLFGHEFPECTAAVETKTRVMVLPSPAERLKQKDVCEYAAMKHFFSAKIWQTVSNGALGAEVKAEVAKELNAMRALLDPQKTAAEGSVPFIGLHLRHKWEFKLTPPEITDVANLLRTVVSEVDFETHRELADATPHPSSSAHPVWGRRPIVFCASDEVHDTYVDLLAGGRP